jgi:ABC-2 type transport system ATP-binding protein
MEPAIATRDLVKEYGDLRALDEMTLTVERSEFFGLLGPNGAGKTTFINLLVGLADLTSGEARVFGHDVVADDHAARDRIGLAPQEFNVDRFFPIREVLMHKAGYHGVPREEAARRADEALRTVGIYEKRDTRFDFLSGGMKRRLLLARALVTDPDLLILDEPTAGVDVQLRHDLWDVITDLNDRGTTILLTTHYIEEAERLCDRVAIMDRGRKVEVATPDELVRRGLDTITVRLRDPPRTTLDLAGLDGVEDVTVDGEVVAVTARRGGETAPRVVTALDDAGHHIVDLDIARTSLEEVFVGMTEGMRGTTESRVGGDRADADAASDDRADVRPSTDGGDDR